MRINAILFSSYVLFLSSFTSADEIRIYTWEEYISDELVERFEKETGHTVKQVFFENELLRDEVINTGRGNIYDLVIVDSINAQSMTDRGLFHSQTALNIQNKEHLNKQSIEACGVGGNPYMWGTMGIAYRTSQNPNPITSWMDIFQPDPANVGKFTVPLDDVDTTAMALLALGMDPFSSNKEDLVNAFELLKGLKNNVLEFRNTVSYTLENQDQSKISLGVAYSGESYILNSETNVDDWVYTVPKEGTLIWYECFAAPAAKPVKPSTIEFLSFLNRPDIAAENAEAVWYATVNDSAILQTSEEYQNDTELFPGKEIIDKSFYYKPVNLDGLKLRNRMISVLNN